MKQINKTIVLKAEKKDTLPNTSAIFEPTLLFVESGEIHMSVGEADLIARKSSLIIISPFDNISIKHIEEGTSVAEINIDDSLVYTIPSPMLISVIRSRPDSFSNVIDCSGDPLVGVIIDKIYEEYVNRRVLRETTLDNSIIQLLIEIYRLAFKSNQTKHIKLVTDIEKILDEEYMKEITIESLANQFYLDRYYLSHIFREYTGYSLKQYLTYTRLNHARILLATTAMSINEICQSIGFSDINNFIRYFRKEYRITPLAYRKSLK